MSIISLIIDGPVARHIPPAPFGMQLELGQGPVYQRDFVLRQSDLLLNLLVGQLTVSDERDIRGGVVVLVVLAADADEQRQPVRVHELAEGLKLLAGAVDAVRVAVRICNAFREPVGYIDSIQTKRMDICIQEHT